MPTSMFRGEVLDVIIIGAGPAGLSAAVNTKVRNLRVIVIDPHDPVAKVRTYLEVTNYLGFPKVSGAKLAERFYQHFAKTGFPYKKERATKIVPMEGGFLTATSQNVYRSSAVILTVGVVQTKMLPGEEQYLGRGVSYCVTCDGALFRGKDVVVVGYISEGEEEANALAGLARSVTYVATYDNVQTLEKTVKLVHTTPKSVEGDSRMHGLMTELGEIKADGIFIAREAVPMGTLLEGLVITDNYIDVDGQMATSIPGVFAAGDCIGPPFQIAKSVGQGQVAGLSAARHVYKERKKGS